MKLGQSQSQAHVEEGGGLPSGRASRRKKHRYNITVMRCKNRERNMARVSPRSDVQGTRSVLVNKCANKQNTTARAFPTSDAQRSHSVPVKKCVNEQNMNMRVGTLNVGTMTGKSREVVDMMERRHIEILCVQETRWKGSKARELGEDYKLYYNGTMSSRNGVGIILHKKHTDAVLEVKRINDHIMLLRMDLGVKCLTVVSCYAPQVGRPQPEKEDFWESLYDTASEIKDEHWIVCGDFNGHVGRDNSSCHEVHGGNGVGTQNNEGNSIIDFAMANELRLANTFFKSKTDTSKHIVVVEDNLKSTSSYILLPNGGRFITQR